MKGLWSILVKEALILTVTGCGLFIAKAKQPSGVRDADLNNIEFVMVDEKAQPINIESIKPTFPEKYRDDPHYNTSPVKVSMFVYIGSDGTIKNFVDCSVGTIPQEFIDNAKQTLGNIEWIPAKKDNKPVGTWIAFDIIFNQPE